MNSRSVGASRRAPCSDRSNRARSAHTGSGELVRISDGDAADFLNKASKD